MAENEAVEEVVEDVAEEVVAGESVEQDTESSEAEAPALEDWQLTGEEETSDDDNTDVPVGKVIQMKERLRGKIADEKSENALLKDRIAKLEAGTTQPAAVLKPRPKEVDFDTDELYNTALEQWDDARLEAKITKMAAGRDQTRTVNQQLELRTKAVAAHYDRVDVLASKSNLSASAFKEADGVVREAVESIIPGGGDAITDDFIAQLGEGSEKAIVFLGINKPALAEFKGLLAEDPRGLKALAFIAKHQGRLNNPGKTRSSAPKPASNANGDAVVSQTETALKKKYDKAHEKGGGQAAYNVKQEAKKAKIDTSSW